VYEVGEGAGGLGESKVSRVWISLARGLAEEGPVAYKDVDEVVSRMTCRGLSGLAPGCGPLVW